MKNGIKFGLKGFDEVFKKLDKLNKEAESFKEQKVIFSELFSPAFMNEYTQFNSIDEMIEKSPFKVESEKDFKNIEWGRYVKSKTSFQSWNEMMSKADEEYKSKRIKQSIGKVFKK